MELLTTSSNRIKQHSNPLLVIKAMPWKRNQIPRDRWGLLINDYRVTVIASKKSSGKSAVQRRRLIRKVKGAMRYELADYGTKGTVVATVS
ncbi:hypothetical protein EV182_008032 [Spiromyces aspiralis]|uniref:Uncharacterized protein n=1 Tax=Spiromyces aspiralis TaxID=68401 RepID=A0ACC1HRF3_9FUNG|nr:hypothetical protein EV182_008032 [Spiromyces aspiralis]